MFLLQKVERKLQQEQSIEIYVLLNIAPFEIEYELLGLRMNWLNIAFFWLQCTSNYESD